MGVTLKKKKIIFIFIKKAPFFIGFSLNPLLKLLFFPLWAQAPSMRVVSPWKVHLSQKWIGWRVKMELPSSLDPETKLGLLGRLLTCIGLHTTLWVQSFDMVWKGVRNPRLPSLWADLYYVLLGHI